MTSSRDPLRNTVLRYAGYAGVVAELFVCTFSRRTLRISQHVTTGYILADVATKTVENFETCQQKSRSVWTLVDTLLWQSMATLLIPGFAAPRRNYPANPIKNCGNRWYDHINCDNENSLAKMDLNIQVDGTPPKN
ncbi:mitochondrial fission process protein 1-like isoform X2 [Hermetia illucens]|uniref:mitochondrial fission process protein 1-like isoform X2 n=1 Tax=Hermetia illucens TaxID=343691 RepID=UPI0018CC028A|nr:mitochondrial fission process protein 1-like isoform X2 [Hermetia illucens]